MRDQIVILASSYAEARRFATASGIGRAALTPAGVESIRGIRPTVILELPSYAERRDRHAMNSALRRASTQPFGDKAVIEMLVDPAIFAPVAVPAGPGPDELEGQTTIEQALAAAPHEGTPRTAPTPDLEQAIADAGTRPVEAPEPGYKPRSRAKTKRS